MSFEINIDTGNAAMVQPEDVAGALRCIADKLDEGYVEGPIHDENGNHVGHYNFTLDLTNDDEVLGKCQHGVDLDREFCPEGCRV